MTKPDFGCLLRILAEHGVDFLVVGGVGAVLQGATLSTFDLDIVHSTEPANITRLLPLWGTWTPATVRNPRDVRAKRISPLPDISFS